MELNKTSKINLGALRAGKRFQHWLKLGNIGVKYTAKYEKVSKVWKIKSNLQFNAMHKKFFDLYYFRCLRIKYHDPLENQCVNYLFIYNKI